MYKITMTLCGQTTIGATYNTWEELHHEIMRLERIARCNNFPATYGYITID